MMKNRPSTTAKFYVQFWNNRESLRLAMQCYNDFTPEGTVSSTNTEKEPETFVEVMESSPEKVQNWLETQEKQILENFNERIFDDNLTDVLEGMNSLLVRLV